MRVVPVLFTIAGLGFGVLAMRTEGGPSTILYVVVAVGLLAAALFSFLSKSAPGSK